MPIVHEPSYRASFFEMKAFEIREKPYRPRGRERLWSGKLVGPDQPLAHDRAGETAKISLGTTVRGPGDQPRRAHSGTATHLQPGEYEQQTAVWKESEGTDGFSQRKNLSHTGEEEKLKCCILLKHHAERGISGD